MAKAFEGVKVVDFSRVLAGPFAAQQLALLGADVIKVEEPGTGDQGRQIMADGPLRDKLMSPLYLCVNSGKRSMTLNLKNPGAKDVIHRLVKDANVFIENFKAGTAAKLGFGYEDLKKINPSLVYCSVTGYGQEGPRSKAAAYDGAVQAASGMVSTTGFPESGPVRAGYTVVDMSTGITTAYAITAALYRQLATGEGQHVDVAMFDSALTMLGLSVANYTAAGNLPELSGNSSPARLATAAQYKARDGYIQISALQDAQIFGMFRVMGCPEFETDERFSTRPAREENKEVLREIMAEKFLTEDAAYWVEKLAAAGTPVSPVNTIPQALAEPQLKHRNVIMDIPAPKNLDDPLKLVGSGFQTNVDTPGTNVPPPVVGEHTDEILGEHGYSADEIAALRESGVI